ncbi:MAG: FHA domain-containing protein, partial [Pyrinomonadaceae bacterium]|nr:FHA domain-containing protein [Pyrinomonadaceae bacterium]
MPELYLKYTDESDIEKRILVESEDFFLGRHSENDLTVANPKLSRTHAKIERYDDVYLLSDFDSSNGTKLNDFEVTEPTKLAHGDIIDLGGGLVIEVEFFSDEPEQEYDP